MRDVAYVCAKHREVTKAAHRGTHNLSHFLNASKTILLYSSTHYSELSHTYNLYTR